MATDLYRLVLCSMTLFAVFLRAGGVCFGLTRLVSLSFSVQYV